MATSNSSIAAKVDFICKRGDTFLRVLKFWSDPEKTMPLDISGSSFKMVVIGSCGKFTFEIGAGFEITDVGELTMSKTAEGMKKAPGTYSYDLQQTVGAVVTTIMQGKFIIENDVTA